MRVYVAWVGCDFKYNCAKQMMDTLSLLVWKQVKHPDRASKFGNKSFFFSEKKKKNF